ncbi:hypothetical protein EJ02DRAFT_176656 [Clathrospora elynae]|uniref:DNA/RNA-binding protein Alba-like domain-containing protein n=1 Tax=Clathrospora elynae TaxID=706981 RepID=A0A6A5SQI3_9PLEO|nr:hypothetical protein EJ02DRAFT_176656 [Clathrospora elynae]
MAKPKRMSDMFASSSEKDVNATTITATPPYSSEGPTLPIIGATGNQKAAAAKGSKSGKKRKAQDESASIATKKPSQTPSPPTVHPSLYEPWTRLPSELLKLLVAQSRLRGTQNIVPVVFSKNQNVKTGINRLKTYLGTYKDPASTIEIPEALKQEDVVIAVSAQGEGTTKLVGIVDMTRRIVAPSEKDKNDKERVETWCMYTMLTSVEVERKAKPQDMGMEEMGGEVKKPQDTQEEDAFEPMDIDGKGNEKSEEPMQKRNMPVLTVWMTKKKIPAFKTAFGEQTFTVQKMAQEED